jgi:hypothetical protein
MYNKIFVLLFKALIYFNNVIILKIQVCYNSSSVTAVNMSWYNNSINPCFRGSCTVRLLDGSIKFVKDIQRGDRLYPHGGIVDYVLRTICSNAQAQMVLVCISFL